MRNRCDRCRKQTCVTIKSTFTMDALCMECEQAEREHPDFEKVRAADEAPIRSGTTISLPIGWKRNGGD